MIFYVKICSGVHKTRKGNKPAKVQATEINNMYTGGVKSSPSANCSDSIASCLTAMEFNVDNSNIIALKIPSERDNVLGRHRVFAFG